MYRRGHGYFRPTKVWDIILYWSDWYHYEC